MRKFVLGLTLLLGSLSAGAQHVYQPGHNHGSYSYRGHVSTQHRGFHHGHHRGHHGWVVPALIGGAVVYAVTRPDPVIVQQPPVIVQQPPIIVQPNTVVIDGVAYTKQTMIINGVQQEVLVRN
jgi:hypothetical protein